jgi:hypothetical protein
MVYRARALARGSAVVPRQRGDLIAPQQRMSERRRYARQEVQGEFATIPAITGVEVVDISGTGVLFECSRRFDVGATGTLRLDFGGSPFVADVLVRRATPVAGASTYRIAGSFVNLSDEHRLLIERFIVS